MFRDIDFTCFEEWTIVARSLSARIPDGPFNAIPSPLKCTGEPVRRCSACAQAGYYKRGEASVLPSDARLSFDGTGSTELVYNTILRSITTGRCLWPNGSYVVHALGAYIIVHNNMYILSIDSPNSGREYKYEKKSYETNHESVETTQLGRWEKIF